MSQGQSIDKALRQVQAQGFDVEAVVGNDRLLTLDLDNDLALAVYEENLPILQQYMGCREITRWQSKSGKGWHAVVELDYPYHYTWRAGFQAMLGSDPKRELLGYFNINNRDSEPFVLFKPKQKPRG